MPWRVGLWGIVRKEGTTQTRFVHTIAGPVDTRCYVKWLLSCVDSCGVSLQLLRATLLGLEQTVPKFAGYKLVGVYNT